jgi:hypothetical protein
MFGFSFLLPALASAAISVESTGLVETGQDIYGEFDSDIGNTIGAYIITPLLSVVGTLFFLLIIYSGVLWMTANGQSARVQKAKDILTHSVIGLVIVVSAYALTKFLLDAITNVAT